MSLRERLSEYKRRQEAGEVPPITMAHLDVIYRGANELIASGMAERALAVGDQLPQFELPDESGQLVSSQELLRSGPLAVVFYRGIWCDYCNFELEALEEVYPRIRELGADLVAVSPVTMPNLRAAIRRNKISYRILSDRGNAYADRFGLVYTMSEELRAVWAGFGLDFTKVNGDHSHTMPIPGVYLSGTDGVIQFAEVHPDHWNRAEPADLVAAIEKLIAAT